MPEAFDAGRVTLVMAVFLARTRSEMVPLNVRVQDAEIPAPPSACAGRSVISGSGVGVGSGVKGPAGEELRQPLSPPELRARTPTT